MPQGLRKMEPESTSTDLEWNTYFSNMSRERQDPYQKAAIEKLDKYLLEVGRATNNWNFLQEQLKLIFCFLLRPDQIEANEASQAWYAIESDRGQRNMLRNVARASLQKDSQLNFVRVGVIPPQMIFPHALADIEWFLKMVDGPLADNRNDIVHSPLTAFINNRRKADGEPPNEVAAVIPWVFGNSPRAKKLAGSTMIENGEKVLQKIEQVSNKVFVLAHYASQVSRAFYERTTWPNRPSDSMLKGFQPNSPIQNQD
jgi:hypothetical protein